MFNFVRKAFRKFFEFWLWLNLIVCTVIGGVSFYLTVARTSSWYGGSEVNGGLVFLGIVIGFVVGFVSDILFGGLVATFLNMDANLEKLSNGNLSTVSNEESIDKKTELKKGANEKKPSPTSEKDMFEYKVITNTPLRSEPDESAYPVTSLKVGDKVYYQCANKNSSYFNVNTSDSQNGWCLASHLEKT